MDFAAIISAVFSGIALLVTSAVGAYIAIMNSRIKRTEEASVAVKAAVVEMGATVKVLEKNTNSIREALVEVTEKEALQRGKAEGRAEEKAEVQVIANQELARAEGVTAGQAMSVDSVTIDAEAVEVHPREPGKA